VGARLATIVIPLALVVPLTLVAAVVTALIATITGCHVGYFLSRIKLKSLQMGTGCGAVKAGTPPTLESTY
jgi:hypothetical protein